MWPQPSNGEPVVLPGAMSAGGSPDLLSEVAAVVVAYNSGHVLTECVQSLRAAGLGEIVVVDNASTDDSVAAAASAVPRIKVVTSPRNAGFGGGVNRGVATTETEFVLVCNSDITVERSGLECLVDRLAGDPRAALVGPQLCRPDGTPSVSARAFPTLGRSWRQAFAHVLRPEGRTARRYAARNSNIAAGGGEVDWVTGACFLARREAFEAIGGFDESYFMYVEEVDLCWRLHRAGWRVLHEPRARVFHVGGASAARRPYAMIVAHHRSLWRFARRTSEGAARLALPLVAAGVVVRGVLVSTRQLLRKRSP